jgi:hypothetical protein
LHWIAIRIKKNSGEVVALKILDIASVNSDDIEAIEQEIKILSESKYTNPRERERDNQVDTKFGQVFSQ